MHRQAFYLLSYTGAVIWQTVTHVPHLWASQACMLPINRHIILWTKAACRPTSSLPWVGPLSYPLLKLPRISIDLFSPGLIKMVFPAMTPLVLPDFEAQQGLWSVERRQCLMSFYSYLQQQLKSKGTWQMAPWRQWAFQQVNCATFY